MSKKQKSSNQGQSIVEILIVTAIVATILTSLISLNTNSQKNTTQSKKTDQATQYNAQAVNWLRARRKNLGWELFFAIIDNDTNASGDLTYCLSSLPETETNFENLASANCSSSDTIPNTIFIRELSLHTNSDTIESTITTSWEEKETHEIQNNFKLTKW